MFDLMNQGPLMDEAGDAGGGGGIAAVDTGAVDTGTTETALTVTGDTSLATTEEAEGAESTELTTTTGNEPLLENGRPSKTTSAALATLKTTNPALAKAVPRALAIEARLRAEFPGQNPFDAIRGMQRTMKSIGGEKGLSQIRASLAEMEEMDLLYAGSDPRMLEKMTDSPEGKNAFIRLMPHAFAKLQSLAPNAFSAYFAKTFLNHIVNKRFDVSLARLAEVTPKELMGSDGKTPVPNPAVKFIEQIDNFMQELMTLEKLPSEAPAPTVDPRQAELDTRQAELDRKSKEMELQGWRSSADSTKSRLFDNAWTDLTKGRKISAVDKEDIQSRFWTRLPIAMGQIPGFSNSLKEYYEANDKDGYLRYLQSQHTALIPKVLRAEINRRYGTPAKAVAPGAQAVTAAKVTPEPGFKRVAQRPEMNSVNMRVTNTDMWRKGQAVLKDGTKVQWPVAGVSA